MTYTNTNSHLWAKPLMFALIVLLIHTFAAAQGQYVFTDGTTLLLYNNNDELTDSIGYLNGSWDNEYYASVSRPTSVTYWTKIGTKYIALDTTSVYTVGGDTYCNVVVSNQFSPLCVWTNSEGSGTGYYYQDRGGYRYYLLASSQNGLRVKRVTHSAALTETTTWYDWDFGTAIQEEYHRSTGRVREYYWMMFDASGLSLSCNSYCRPEVIIYQSASALSMRSYYCPLRDGDGLVKGPAGRGAQYSPVDTVYHPRSIAEQVGDKGLQSLVAAQNTLSAGQQTVLTLNADFGGGYTVRVNDAYTEYRVETSRRGISRSFTERSGDEFGKAGVPTYSTPYYFYDDDPATLRTELRTPSSVVLTAADVIDTIYTISNNAKRYLQLVQTTEGATVKLAQVPYADIDATVSVEFVYRGGFSDKRSVVLHLSSAIATAAKAKPVNAPIVRGAVFGGGRMANVEKNTTVTVNSCDTISAVYGGNDISGSVGGSNGSAVQIGTTATTDSKQVHVGSVYGGGNGFYNYQTLSTADKTCGGKVSAMGTGDSLLTLSAGSLVPTIVRTQVVMGSDYARVDSLFGGARNAYVSASADTSVRVVNRGGTVYAQFGGNNYGGTIAEGSVVAIKVEKTKEATARNIENTRQSGFGIDYGVRYMFGGGNRVEAPAVSICVEGGTIDTLFAGGNSASVIGSAMCKINATASAKIFDNPTGELEHDTWVGGNGLYNVRCLFGGNNNAPMDILPSIDLVSGGVGTVYGGGNAGDMRAAVAITDAQRTAYFNATTGIPAPTALGTTVKMASSGIDVDYVYGGCRKANVDNSTLVVVDGGNAGSVFGGCNISGDVGTDPTHYNGTYVVVSGGVVRSNVYGGANGNYHCRTTTADDISKSIAAEVYTDGVQFEDNSHTPFDPYDDYVGLYAPTHNYTHLLMTGGTVGGNMYGGANMANVGFQYNRYKRVSAGEEQVRACDIKAGEVHMTMTGGTVKHNVFGGGNMAAIKGLSYLWIKGTSVIQGSLFAGNDRVGSVESFGRYRNAYAADEAEQYNFVASNGNELNYTDNAHYSAYVRLQETPTITYVYGGGNGAYNYGDQPQYGQVLMQCGTGKSDCPKQTSSYIDINVSGGSIDTVYGGGNGVGVTDEVVVLLNATQTDARYVGTIFGGNNRDTMADCVPLVLLEKGQVRDVYGGSNAGYMGGKTIFEDVCGNQVTDVSTYVLVNSSKVTISGDLYGGCNMADVRGRAYVDIRNTSTGGIQYVYGGNNITGSVLGNTRIDVSGGTVHNIYGGSNGYYDYTQRADGYEVYSYGNGGDPSRLITMADGGSPRVANTEVNIYGGTIKSNVYGGGRMGDCDSTHVVVDDNRCGTLSATIEGTIFGGGEGEWRNLNAPHRGNVTERCYVDLYHADKVTMAKAYGGGQGGDVNNTYITTHEQWDQPFDELYGGCWGSNVFGTAMVTMKGRTDIDGYNVRDLFGGNDFTGNVRRSEVVVESGTYLNIYGAGNGDYADDEYTMAPNYSAEGSKLFVPNTENVIVDFKNGRVDNNIYGGGRYGTTFNYQRDASGNYLTDATGRFIPDTSLSAAAAHTSASDYSAIVVNMHNGSVDGNIYAGAAGRDKLLVYGLKILNMEGGSVGQSIYGGSENVSDGYPAECKSDANTTARPSSILNITGGTVGSHVFGGGYLGSVYGSAYINIGLTAIDSCPVWTNAYRGVDSVYWSYKPGVQYGVSPTLASTDLLLNSSVYGGANWGSNQGVASFNVKGFFGGENRVIIDGEGYNTDNDPYNEDPFINIEKSVIGAGTSANGGDILSRIEIRNYGVLYSDCHASKTLEAVQRADELWLHNTAIRYTGTTDAISSNISEAFSINRIDTMYQRGFNIVEVEARVMNIGGMVYYEDTLDQHYKYVVVKNSPLINSVLSNGTCSNEASMCDRLAVVSPTDASKRHTALVVNNGNSVEVAKEVLDSDGNVINYEYGSITGFGYLLAPSSYNAVVIARYKIPANSTTDAALLASVNYNDGGFADPCITNNYSIPDVRKPQYDIDHWSPSELMWEPIIEGELSEVANHPEQYEFWYTNYATSYRVWSANRGLRRRWATMLAHANPEELAQDKYVKVNGNKLAVAKGRIVLPPTVEGHYYKLIDNSFVLTGDNENVNLIDSAWRPADWDAMGANGSWDVNANPNVLIGAPTTVGSLTSGVSAIYENPATTFGLVMTPGENFYVDSMPASHPTAMNYAVITGNAYVNYSNSFCSSVVQGHDQTSPIMDLYLTYSNNFSTTFLGTVNFKFQEYVTQKVWDEDLGDSVYVDVALDMPIEIEIIISTVLKEFTDIKQEVLAMYNEGRKNVFSRKVVLPATLQHRELYVTSVRWTPTDIDGNDEPDGTMFRLTKDEETITSAADGVIDIFGMQVRPADNISSSISTSIGWHSIDADTINLFKLTEGRASETGDPRKHSDIAAGAVKAVQLTDLNNGKGYKVGELDGRGLAVLNVDLLFDGNRVYSRLNGHGYVGKVELLMRSYYANVPMEDDGFTVTIYVKTREHGDTIYLASAPTVRRGGITLTPYDATVDHAEDMGKTPQTYVRSFQTALKEVYQEGDVVAILDTVKITNGDHTTIQGSEYNAIPVIRYFGHNGQFMGEECVYRGPMIIVGGEGDDAMFNAKSIAFDGSAMGKVQYKTESGGVVTYHMDNDTNRAYGPVISVINNGTVTLDVGSSIMHNWNESTNASAQDKGAISITNGGVVSLEGDVDIADNFSHYFAGDNNVHPYNGAVYVDGGTLRVKVANTATKQTIVDNYVMPDGATTWWEDNGLRYVVKQDVLDTWSKANVFLTRTEGTGDVVMNDQKSDMIVIESRVPSDTRIGISKWFPGEEVRDTIRAVTQYTGNRTYILSAANDSTFVSDDGYNIFYSRSVSSDKIYLHRCATFKQQLATEDVLTLPALIEGSNPLTYVYNEEATCPTGGDTLFYHVQGGFYPYEYTWTGASDRHRRTSYTNINTQSRLAAGDITPVQSASVDTMAIPRVLMNYYQTDTTLRYTVVAKDVAGCRQKKQVELKISKVVDVDPVKFKTVDITPVDAWTMRDTVVVAKAERNYHAIQIEPRVWADRSNGTIVAAIGGMDTIFTENDADPDAKHPLQSLVFCEGDVIQLATASKRADVEFIMWDFDPFYTNPATYIVPSQSTAVIAYYGPKDYWIDYIDNTEKATAALCSTYNYERPAGKGYVTEYNGDVHIYDENGLAWFISVVNGLNGTQARQFYFNKVFLHQKPGNAAYDMRDHLWTPIGTSQHPFSGWFIGVAENDTTPLPQGQRVVVKNVIVNEPNANYSGFFGHLDGGQPTTAKLRISGLELQGTLVRGAQYVGALAAEAADVKIDNCAVLGSGDAEGGLDDALTSILSTHYVSGGMLGRASHSVVTGADVAAKYVGDAVYSGGVIGYGENDTVNNTGVRNDLRMSGVYYGGVAGNMTASDPVVTLPNLLHRLFAGRKSVGEKSYIANNYIRIDDNGHSQRAGGIVGKAENTIIENNYVYGNMQASVVGGSVAALMGNNTVADANYAESGMSDQTVGLQQGSAYMGQSAQFKGSGNAVAMDNEVSGVTNLTRALNRWANAHNGSGNTYSTWRSDLDGVNHGYPLFGSPDMIPVFAETEMHGCEEIVWNGHTYHNGDVFEMHVIDSTEMVDSTLRVRFVAHSNTTTQYTDSAIVGNDYSGYGFNLTAVETRLVAEALQQSGRTSITLCDTLVGTYGCDSIISLTLSFTNGVSTDNDTVIDISVEETNEDEVKAYPNPTVDRVTVEAHSLQQVEVYDSEGRRMQAYPSQTDSLTIDVSHYASGVYYLRVYTEHKVNIQKLIKR